MKKGLTKYKQILKDNALIKVSRKNTVPVLLQFVIGLLKIKLISVWLGTSGMALLSQFENFFQLGANVSSGGINQGITKIFAASNNDEKHIISSTALVITLTTSFIVSILLFLFSDFISIRLMHSQEYSNIIKFSGGFVFLFNLSNTIRNALKGEKRHNSFIFLNIFEITISFILIVSGAYYGLKPAIWCTMIALSSVGIMALIRYNIFTFPIHFSKKTGKQLSGFSLMFIVAAIIAPLTQIILRSIIFEHCSIEEAGWWDGIRRISRTYTSLITTTIGLYFLPRISEISSNKELNKELRSSLKTILPFVALGSLSIFLSRGLIIRILFTEEFLPMKSLFLFQCATDVLKIISWLLATSLVMREKIKSYIFSEIFMFIFIISINYFMISHWGIEVSTLTSLISTSIYVLILSLLWKKNSIS